MERASRGIPKGSYKGEIAEIRFFTIDYSFEIYPRSGDNNSELRIPNSEFNKLPLPFQQMKYKNRAAFLRPCNFIRILLIT